MDPLSITLAAITLATAVKDMVELADKISACFERVSENLRISQLLANEIVQTIYDLKRFYDMHKAELDSDAQLLKAALMNLTSKLGLFHAQVTRLMPTARPHGLHRIKTILASRKNSSVIENSIRALNEEVKACKANFMMMSAARAEVKLHQAEVKLNKLLTSVQTLQGEVQQALGGVNHAQYPLVHPTPARSSSLDTTLAPATRDASLIAFAQTSSSTSTPLWKKPSAIKINTINWDLYIKEQVDYITSFLSSISSLRSAYPVVALEADSVSLLPVAVTLQSEHRNPDRLMRDIVEKALQIRRTLEDQPISTSTQDGPWTLYELSLGLHHLNMPDEAVEMGLWSSNLFRELAVVDARTYAPLLAHTLKHLSQLYNVGGGEVAAFEAIREAVHVSRGLQSPDAPLNLQLQHCAILTIYAKHVRSLLHCAKGVETASTSLEHMKRIIGFDCLPEPYTKDEGGLAQVNQLFLDLLYRTAPSDHAVVEYARALRELSDCLVRAGQLQESLDLKLFALAIFYDLPLRISPSMNEELAGILRDIITQPTKSLLPPEKRLAFAEDYLLTVQKRVDSSPSLHGETLCDALWEKAMFLNHLDRHDDAVVVWKEIADLAQALIQDQLYYAHALSQVSWSFRNLKSYDEAISFRNRSLLTYHDIGSSSSSTVAATASQAYSYYDLCIDFQLAQRYDEAAQAARKAVQQSRALALDEDRHVWVTQVGRGQTALANSLLHAGDHSSALDEGLEALTIFDQLVETDSSRVGYYLYALRVNLEIAMTVKNATTSIARLKEVNQRYRRLAAISPEDVGLSLLEAEIDYGHNLDRLDRLNDARGHFEALLAQWDSISVPGHSKDQLAHLHISAHISYASVLDNQGHTKQALEQILRAAQIGQPFCQTHPDITGQTLGAMHRHAQLLAELGRYQEALDVAEETLAFSRTVKIDDLSNIVGAMHVVAIAADRLHMFDRVIHISQEAVDLCRGSDIAEYCQTDTRALILLPRSLQFLSSGQTDLGLSDGFRNALEAVKEAEKLKSNPLMASVDAKKSYMDATAHLGTVLFARKEFSKALGIFEERRIYLQDRVKQRNGEYSDLVAILYRLGIMYCHRGRHDEGASMAQELTDILSRLQIVLPGLHKLVMIDMQHELTIPTLRELQTFRAGLNCNHQSYVFFDS